VSSVGGRSGSRHPDDARARTRKALAAAVARRLRERGAGDESEPEILVSLRLEVLIERTMEAVETKCTKSLERYLDGIVSASARHGFSDSSFFLASTETRRALAELRISHGQETDLHSYWRVLRYAEDYFLRRVAACLEAQCPEGARPIPLLEALPQVLLLLDESGRIRYANASVRHVFGLSPRSLVGSHLLELSDTLLLPGMFDEDAFFAATARILMAPDETHDDIFRLVDGSTYVRRSLPVTGDGPLRQLVVITPITDIRGSGNGNLLELAPAEGRRAATSSSRPRPPVPLAG
jgi:PAS domain-containing protein